MPPGRDEPGDRSDEGGDVGHVLDDLQADDGVEGLARRTQLLDAMRSGSRWRGLAPRRGGARRRSTQPWGRCRSRGRRGGRAAPRRARRRSRRPGSTGQRAASDPAAPGSAVAQQSGRPALADEAQPRRTLLMQRAELAVGVPPLAGEPLEALDLARVEVGVAAVRNARGGFHSAAIRAAIEQIVKARILRRNCGGAIPL